MKESRIFKALELLLQQSEHSQCLAIKKLVYQGHIQVASEFCTVSIKCTRRAGHTTAIFQIIDKYYGRGDVVVYCLPNIAMCLRVEREWKMMFPKSEVVVYFCVFQNINSSNVCGFNRALDDTDIVFVDNYSYNSREQSVEAIDKINSMATRSYFEKKKPFYVVEVQ
jgi:hypothetical protein